MFDVAFSELLVIAVVALIVIGPEKLPKVARTLGLLAGRMQRYVVTVKSDIERELQAEELRKLQTDVRQQVASVEHELQNEARQVESGVTSTVEQISNPGRDSKPAA